ncbi:M48 family metallopeptidase [Alteromonas sp. a30]|uniref:M48 family metallopeptidase n=1 Tax=Alteromonas sp. a30 TaxID=2730917 RepID=UPI00227DEFA1|nr:M48 family metallopeptidase [Alteromonas sp. a30]MCY7296112.1 M48 family metallopeptidase [Alteromonas sp. a30]
MSKPSFIAKTVFVLSLFLLVTSCAKSPTGRNQFKFYGAAQMDEMGRQAFDSIKKESKTLPNSRESKYVNCVARHITPQVPKHVFSGEWEVVVFDDEQINAFALPGGKIGVYTGLLNVATTQDQLAAVIGHEVGHVIAEHGNERMSSGTLINLGMQVTSQILDTQQVGSSKEIMSAIGVGLQVGVQLPFSRTHETEADLIGLDLMAKAGFNPQASVTLWQNMEKASGGNAPLEFLSTHPAPTTRIEQLKANMKPALQHYNSTRNRPQCTL